MTTSYGNAPTNAVYDGGWRLEVGVDGRNKRSEYGHVFIF